MKTADAARPRVQSVWDHLLLRARLGPHEVAVHAPRGPVSRLALITEVAGLATELLEQGIAGERMVGLAFADNPYLHLLLLLALDRLDIPATSLPMPLEPEPLAAFAKACGVTSLITSEPPPADPSCRWIRMPEPHRPNIGHADRARLAAITPAADALVQVIWSSGTTGSPKGTPLTRARQMRRIVTSNLLRGHSSASRHFLAMPLGTIYGYNIALGLLMAGGTVILPTIHTVLELADALGINAMGVTVPMLRHLIEQHGALRQIERMRIDVMGSSLPPKLAQDARYHLTPRLTLIYGTTEAVTIATGDAALCIADPCAVGFLVPWVEAEIVDESGTPQPSGREGILRVRGAQIVDSYHGDEAATAAMFRGGWFYPGEIGTVIDGLLRITGRLSEAIRHDGAVIGAVPIEAALASLPGVRDAAVFALPSPARSDEQIAAALVLEPDTDLAALQAAMHARLGAHAPARLMTVAQLPRNPNGKVLKRELQARAAAEAVASAARRH